jgi:sugar/nucleoside kinase (ribokinase family)
MQYIVCGPSIVNEVVRKDGSTVGPILGGSVFCVAGIRLWTANCGFVSNVGPDFESFYGSWFAANGLRTDLVSKILPHTWHTRLTYGDEGIHSEDSIYGQEDEELLGSLDIITADQVCDAIGDDTRGIYLESAEGSPFWQEVDKVREASDAKIMWEIPTSATMDASRHEGVMKTISLTDMFSVNLPEARSLFATTDEKTVISRILDTGRICFLRAGERGSYMIMDGKATFSPSLTVGEIVDPTGCGNASTAAALYGCCEGLAPDVTARLANISAAYNLLQYGPYPLFSDAVMSDAKALLESKEA